MLTLADIQAAATRIATYINHPPVLRDDRLDALADAAVFFKAEHRQSIHAFKIRGATNAVLQLSEDVAAHGVVTHSSGNHGAAVAYAARIRGVRATVVMPGNVPATKRANVLAQGGHIVDCEPTLASREAVAARVLAETSGTLIHPYNDLAVMAGQGTAALELLTAHPDLDVIMCPVGGGGLLSGTAVVTRALAPAAQVIGAEPAAAADAAQSLRTGQLTRPATPPVTIADGLRGALGDLTFAEIQRHVHRIWTIDEAAIVDATRVLQETFGEPIEPSSAVPFAALLAHRRELPARCRIGIILTGGNVDPVPAT